MYSILLSVAEVSRFFHNRGRPDADACAETMAEVHPVASGQHASVARSKDIYRVITVAKVAKTAKLAKCALRIVKIG